jgi:predicted nucleic acid-binding protein
MKLVIDANVVISALIADSKTRELIVTLEPGLLTPAFVHDEIENYEDLIVEKSEMEPDRVAQFIDLLFQYIDVVPASEFYPVTLTMALADPNRQADGTPKSD